MSKLRKENIWMLFLFLKDPLPVRKEQNFVLGENLEYLCILQCPIVYYHRNNEVKLFSKDHFKQEIQEFGK